MGIFSKKNVEEKEETKVLEEAKEIEAAGRFLLLVEGFTTPLDGQGVIITGTAHGTVKKGQGLFALAPEGRVIDVTVSGIEAKQEDGKMKIVDQAADCIVNLSLSCEKPEEIKKYAVLSSVEPQGDPQVKKPVENPTVAAFLYELPRLNKDKNFFGMLVYSLVHGAFITPLKLESLNDEEKEKLAPGKDTKIGFYMLRQGDPKAPVDKDSKFLAPLFTSWEEFEKFELPFKECEKPRIMALNFMNAVQMTLPPQFEGFVVNPFSKNQIVVNKALIESIVKSDGFVKEFGEVATAPVAPEDKPKKNVILGVPKESEEVSAIKDTLVEYGKSNDDIQSLSFLIKLEEDKTQRYLIVIGTDASVEDTKKHMQGMFERIQPLAKEVTKVEFSIKGRVKGIDDIVAANAEKMEIYSA